MNNSRQLILRFNENDYEGWENISVTRSMDQTTSSYSITVSDPDPDFHKAVQINPGTLIEILYGGDLLVTGYIDSVKTDYSNDNHTIQYEGRGKTKDLVDCSALESAQFTNQTPLQIAQKLTEPYGIRVVLQNVDKLDPIPSFQINQDGETVHAALERLVDMAQLYMGETPTGDLYLARLGSSRSRNTLVKTSKTNTAILNCSFQVGEHIRYSEIIVKGQGKASDKNFGKNVSQVVASAIDPEIRRRRIKIIRATVETTTDKAQDRAEWEIKAAAGKGTELTYTVQDWSGNQEQLWRENQLVNVTDDLCGINNVDLVISRVDYHLNENGTTCVLVLNPPESFLHEPKDPKKGNKNKKLKKKVGSSTSEFWDSSKETL